MRFGPVWPEADGHLVFDAASGDFWVLSSVCRYLLERLVQEGPLDPDALRCQFESTPSSTERGEDWISTVAGLVAAGLLQESGASMSPAR